MAITAKSKNVWPAVAIAVVTMVCAGLVLRKTFSGDGVGEGMLPWWSLLLAAVWTAGGLGLLWAKPRTDRAPARWHDRAVLATLVIALAISAASFIGGWVLWLFPPTSGWVGGALLAATSVPLALTALVALIAGAAEEVFFRLGFANLWHGIWRWIVPNGLYALVTLATGNLALALVAPVLGMAATTARELTGRWWAPILVHAVWTIAMVVIFPLAVGVSAG